MAAEDNEKTPELKQHPLMGVCVACGKSIIEGDVEATQVDEFWTCGSDCMREYQEASVGWSEEKLLRVKQWQKQAVKEAMQQPVTVKEMLWKLLPLWILIAINIFVITGLARGGSKSSAFELANGIVFFFSIVLIVFDVIYLIVWETITRPREDED
jgi:hypothetical protein